jgi:prepilin-type N-terminal cleavage/methylation domain-containing protein
MKQKKQKNKGFTLVELLVVIFVIGLISSLLVVNWRNNEQQYLIRRMAQEVVLNIRKTQNMALNSLKYQEGVPPYYGLYFTQASSSYEIFADKNGNNEYDSDTDILVDTINIIQGAEISSLSGGTTLNLTFSIPDGFTRIKPQATSATITLKRVGGTCPQNCKNIRIINTGQVNIE